MAVGLRVVFIPAKGESDRQDVWQQAFERQLPSRHRLHIFDHDEDLASQLDAADVVVDLGGWGTRSMMDAAGSVRLWQVLGTGVDHFDLEYASARFVVANCPGQTSAIALAECALMHMLMLSRRMAESARLLRSGVMWHPVGSEISGKSLLLIGFGASGRALAVRAHALGMHVRALDEREFDPREPDYGILEFAGDPGDLDTQLPLADFVSLHLPLTNATRGILNARRIGLLAPTAHLINVARGALVDEDALAAAVARGDLAGAGLDVFTSEPPHPENPLLHYEEVSVSAHIAGVTFETAERRAAVAVANVELMAVGAEAEHVIASPPKMRQ